MALNNKYYSSDLDGDRQLRLEHRFLVLRKLGQGTYGKVQLALNKETNVEVAVKTIKKAKIENEEDMLRIRREIHIMTSLRHPHIIHIHEVFETRQKIVIVMQYASGGELYDYLGCHQTLPEDEARRIFRQISSAIYYCHKNQICHRDLKLENILLDDEGNAQIADFGLSNIFDDNRRMNTFCGSPLYASPEIVKGTPYKGPEVDCWSLGVLLYTLVYGTMPFDGRSFKELVSQISEGRYEEPIYKSNASSLIRWLLTPDISRRATIMDVCKDSWVNEGYVTSLLDVAENMALSAGLHREQIRATKLCLETNTKNGREKSIFRKAATQLEEKAGKFTSLFAKNFENIIKTGDTFSKIRKPSFYEQITNYDVRFVLNKIIAAVEASLIAEKYSKNLNPSNSNINSTCNVQKKEETGVEKIDSAYIIPIFEVTSTIPNKHEESLNAINKNNESSNIISKILSKPGISKSQKERSDKNCATREGIISDDSKVANDLGNQKSLKAVDGTFKKLPTVDTPPRTQTLLTDSQKQFYSLNIAGQPDAHKADIQSRKLHDPPSRHPSQKSKRVNDTLPVSQKQPGPFMRTKHHVLTLARLLSLNYEKIMRNSFRMPTCKKKLPGKIKIPPNFDPNNPLPATTKVQEEKKELFIFPTVSVSENKEKIEKKIDKIKKAALNKNLIIRSDSKTRIRIEKYIRSQVKRIQDLVREEQRSLQASLEHLDEQSLRDMSEMYYRAFGSENTDSGIANTEDDEYFCFLCSKPSNENGTSRIQDSFILDSIKKGCLYTSNHLHIPRGKEQNIWGYSPNNSNIEFGSLSKCKSEIEFPIEYLNYISSNNTSDLNKTYHKQQIQRNDIGSTKYFLTVPSITTPDSTNVRILRSASDSVSLYLNKNTFDVIKLNNDDHHSAIQNKLLTHFLEQTTSEMCNHSQTTDYETQSTATDTLMNASQILENDDGIGDSNESFQSYIETLENNVQNDSEIIRSMSSHSYNNFTTGDSQKKYLLKKMSNKSGMKDRYEDENFEKLNTDPGSSMAHILDSPSWIETLDRENGFCEQRENSRGLRRRNTMSCLHRKSETSENLNFDKNSTEFENYLWNAYKEHLLENNQNDTDYSSSPNQSYYSLGKKTKLKSRDCKSMDYINGESNSDFLSKEFSNFMSLEQDSNEVNSMLLKKILKHSNVTKNCSDKSASRLNRTKSICSETLTDSDREDIIRRLRQERKFSQGNAKLECSAPLVSSVLHDLQKRDQGRKDSVDSNRRRYSRANLPLSKRTKSEYKKSFLQLLALKRIQEAEKELDKAPPRNDLLVEENNSGSLLEALKTHGYKTVISQRFQDTDDDFFDPIHMNNLKSTHLRAELARLNYLYYESLPRYTLDPYDENCYMYDDLDYTRGLLNGLSSTSSYYDNPPDFRQQKKQNIRDWLDTTQISDYLSTIRPDTLYIPEETMHTPETRRCCTQWGRENYRSFDDESTSESQDTVEESCSNDTFNDYPKSKGLNISNETKSTNAERFQTNSVYSDDERQESVQDRIWRKSFYSRFNNRALSRKERSSFIEPELSESRLGLLNNIYINPLKTGYETPELLRRDLLQRDGSNKSFHIKKSKKHSPSFDKFESRSSLKKKCVKPVKESENMLDNQEPSSNKNLTKTCNASENEEPEH